MKEIIILKYDELWLKSKKTRIKMQKKLISHLKEVINAKEIKVKREFIEIEECYNFNLLKAIPGISLIEKRKIINSTDIEDLWNEIEKWIRNYEFKTFGVRVKRKFKNYPFKSKDVEKVIGEKIYLKYNKKVNLTNPDLWIRLEIYKNKTHLIEERIKGLGGLPYASEGKCSITHPSYYLIKEIVKRGMYIDNLPEELRYLYPPRQISQEFEVIFSPNCFENIKNLKKTKNKLVLYPFIYLNKKEFDKYEKETLKFYKKIKG